MLLITKASNPTLISLNVWGFAVFPLTGKRGQLGLEAAVSPGQRRPTWPPWVSAELGEDGIYTALGAAKHPGGFNRLLLRGCREPPVAFLQKWPHAS